MSPSVLVLYEFLDALLKAGRPLDGTDTYA